MVGNIEGMSEDMGLYCGMVDLLRELVWRVNT